MFCEESVNWTASGANPRVAFEINCATGIDTLLMVVLEFVRLARLVSLIVVYCPVISKEYFP